MNVYAITSARNARNARKARDSKLARLFRAIRVEARRALELVGASYRNVPLRLL